MLTTLTLAILLVSANCKPRPQKQICFNSKCQQNININTHHHHGGDHHYHHDGDRTVDTNYNQNPIIYNNIQYQNTTNYNSTNSPTTNSYPYDYYTTVPPYYSYYDEY